ncbi:MAG: pyridoxamine 5'-phosphate oxidase family protein [Candidatus Bathyarchaeota archaeon]
MRFHVRRKDKEITDEGVMKKILKSTQYVTLAMARDNKPYLVSLSHGYDEENHCIYFHCAKEGKKLEYLKENPNVWGQALIDRSYKQGECDHLYITVMFQGKVTFLEDIDERWHAISLMTRQLDKNAEKMIADRKPDSMGQALIGKISIDYMSGKKSEEVTI